MATLKAVTFDCAQTLIAVDWRPAVLAVECAIGIGLKFNESEAAQAYDNLLRSRWTEFQDLNLLRNEEETDAFWHRMSLDWAEACGFPSTKVAEIVALAEEKLFGQDSAVFSVFSDVVPTLKTLKSRGLKLAVVSNWDISLHKTLRIFGLSEYFDVVVASMEEGFEKPDPRLFRVALDKLGVEPHEAVHVGDNPLDDLKGAKSVGMKAFVIDRGPHSAANIYLSSLTELPEKLGL